jgi:hypothetical protein
MSANVSRTGAPVVVVLRQEIPPPVVLPMPAFATWDEAVDYARGMFARTRYLQGQLPTLSENVSQAQINLAAAEGELVQLLAAATQLLASGTALA